MQKPQLAHNEKERLQALKEYEILDTLPEEELDNITRLASEICQTPVSYISLIDEKRQWFKSKVGLEQSETPRDVAFCAHTIHSQGEPLIVRDSRKDERFHDNPLVTGSPHVVFYAGIPLINPEGFALGTLCIVDQRPRQLTRGQIDALIILAKQAGKLFELRRSNLQLRSIRSQLEERNSNLDKFASIVSHDLRSPLSTIISYIELFRMNYGDRVDDKGAKLLDTINNTSYKLKRIIEGILDYYRSESLSQLKTEAIFLPDFFESLLQLINFPTHAKITYPLHHTIHTNRSALTQIFMNLLGNSLRYNNKSIPVIEIDLREDRSFYHFSISDNGTGIPADKLEMVFELFNTAVKKDQFGMESTGIGLSVVKRIVNNMGGSIRIESEPDIKTTFFFNIKKEAEGKAST
jgi:hypothetical protein